MCLKCWIILLNFTLSVAEYLGDNCTFSSGGNGQCLLISECQPAMKGLKVGLRPQHCGFQGNEPIVCCPKNNQKSKQKCLEYMDRAKIPDAPGIVGGLSAYAREFPHMVALGFGQEDDIQWLCGGSLISEKFVLTASHCLESPISGPVKWARMGTVLLKDQRLDVERQDFEIAKSYQHPDYKPPSTYNDIALLELNKPIRFSEYVHQACIHTEFDTPKQFIATGWGRLEYLGSTSNDLMKVDLELYSKEICRKRFANFSRQLAKGVDEETQICAGGSLNERKDTCQGDSGGPLQVVALDAGFTQVYNIIGITSFGKGCGVVNFPAIYTRVSHYVPWIESIVWP